MQTTLLFYCAGSLVKMSHKLIDGYEKAYNDNIPLVDVVMMGLFIEKDENFISYEISNKKSNKKWESIVWRIRQRIYVQVKRTGSLYSLICA
jgi:hypothetical protein